jgi:hypothetical protein
MARKQRLSKNGIIKSQRKELANYAYNKVAQIQKSVAGPGAGAVTKSNAGLYTLSSRSGSAAQSSALKNKVKLTKQKQNKAIRKQSGPKITKRKTK